ncbi:NAD(P)-binding protein [Pleurotus eryngii]|uniref:NAD(P)-binding protein n=1 Tax=Pleurotus eryngii TaxID=5323 RepID=A0A9P5ZUS9_PLEER|nr:NAD(P)-binding protein [Pleurotus eryngii]
MAPVKNGRHLFNEIPVGYPIPGKTTVYDDSQTIDLDTVQLNGGILIKALAFSIDPYMRGMMRPATVKSYVPAYTIGKPLGNSGVGVVLRSENSSFKPGDHVYAYFPFQEYIVQTDVANVRVLENKENLPWSTYVGAAGMPGQTAYIGWKVFSKAKKGETVFVTTGAGPVGSIVAQLAKHDGLKVIASAGSDEKVEFMKKIGVDVAFNYKTTDTVKVLEEHGPIDIYWDNVGGATLEAALDAASNFARFIECGMISQYNETSPYGVKNLWNIITKRLSVNGFLVLDHMAPESTKDFYDTVPAMIAKGDIVFLEDKKYGLEKVGEAILDVQSGKNHGKSVIVVAEE